MTWGSSGQRQQRRIDSFRGSFSTFEGRKPGRAEKSMFKKLIPTDAKFFELFSDSAKILQEAAKVLGDIVSGAAAVKDGASRLERLEHDGTCSPMRFSSAWTRASSPPSTA